VILDVLVRLLSPILPHTCDEVMESLHGPNATTIQGAPALKFNYTTAVDWQPVLQARRHVLKLLEDAKVKGIENSLDAGVKVPHSIPSEFLTDLADLFGVSRVEFHDSDSFEITDLQNELRCERSWKRDATVAERDNGAILSERDYNAIK
ncbi:MAG: class I tRNA ligase family protein, partial [Candidatus Margulisiibacteriota bacterium]